eukprot:TRINITY_DN8906_c0_g1_i1.p2 TRINITY_DN8906_c0_g1~~TRINITY_DN8906_c0_g1_i1.p2  ORF type:complete len:102 (-),score=24.84 TRINITY_DN8906_c0_g1_i1:148-453(-)
MDDDKNGCVSEVEFLEWMPCVDDSEEKKIFQGIDVDHVGGANSICYKEWMAKFADLDYGPKKDYELEIKEFAGMDVKGYTGPHVHTASRTSAVNDPSLTLD